MAAVTYTQKGKTKAHGQSLAPKFLHQSMTCHM